MDGYGVLYKVFGIGDDRYDYRYFTGPQREGATKGKYYQGVPMDKLNLEKVEKKIPINSFMIWREILVIADWKEGLALEGEET